MAYSKKTQFVVTDDDEFGDFVPANVTKSTENGETVIQVEQDGSIIELSPSMARDLSATLGLIQADQ